MLCATRVDSVPNREVRARALIEAETVSAIAEGNAGNRMPQLYHAGNHARVFGFEEWDGGGFAFKRSLMDAADDLR